jgi:hypothetical protein
MATYAPDHEPNMGSEVPDEFKEPDTRAPELSMTSEPDKTPEVGLDAGDTDLAAEADLEAEVLFQVGHYSEEYKAPASLADIAFEIQEKDTKVHEAMMKAVEEGTPKVEPVLKSLIEQGLVMETEFGGYITTPDGDEMLQTSEVQSDLGGTYESKKHRGDPTDTGAGDENETMETEKMEMGIPFLEEYL